MSFETLDFIADLYNPILLLGILTFTVRHSSKQTQKLRWAASFVYEIGLYLGVVYGLMFLDLRHGLWPSLGWDYSTHTAFALALVWPLWLYGTHSIRWFWPISFLAYLALMVYQGYHSTADILSTMLIISIIIAGVQRVLRPEVSYRLRHRLA